MKILTNNKVFLIDTTLIPVCLFMRIYDSKQSKVIFVESNQFPKHFQNSYNTYLTPLIKILPLSEFFWHYLKQFKEKKSTMNIF